MKSIRICMIIAALCCMVPAVAQQKFGYLKYTHMCSYYGEEINGEVTAFSAGPTAEKVIKKIMSVIGLKANFQLREANVPNAAAVMLNGKRFILYNPKFMDQINSTTGTNWAAISILAHEIGHHLNGHTLDNVGSRPQTELDADEFSGFVLHKMGASLPDAQAVMALISSPNGTKTHPPKRDRLSYIAAGWDNAGGDTVAVVAAPAAKTSKPATTVAAATAVNRPIAATNVQKQAKTVAAKPKPSVPVPDSKLRESIAASARSDVYFSDNPGGEYYLTGKGNLIQVENDKVYLVGSIYKSDRRGFNIMFADDKSNKIYVGTGGELVNSQGRKIGYMKSR